MLSRAEKGSNNRRKLRDKLDKVHEGISNQRADFLHKLSRMYVNEYDIFCVEDLDVKVLKGNGHDRGYLETSMMHLGLSSCSCFRTRLKVLVES
jgi:transposase